MKEIRIHAIQTASDDGSEAVTIAAADLRRGIAWTSDVFKAADIRFAFDPETDLDPVRSSTLLNHDSTLGPGANLNSPESQEPGDTHPNIAEQNRIANEYLGKLVVYFSACSRCHYNADTKKWEWGGGTFSWSNDQDNFVRICGAEPLIAHEVGHYLHLGHTFGALPATMKEAKDMVRDYVIVKHHSKEEGDRVFDGDWPLVTDTNPDPGTGLFQAAGLDPCNPSHDHLDMQVDFEDGTPAKNYVLRPDRENIMNYWDKLCRGLPIHVTGQQAAIIRDALEKGNRSHLVSPRVVYDAIFEPGQPGQTRVLGWNIQDFAARFDKELARGRHLVQMQAYKTIDGQTVWNGVWESGARVQTRAICWAFSDFVARFDKELSEGKHIVHMQAYDIGGGEIRWDGVWERGSGQQTRAIAWSKSDFSVRFDREIAAGKHCVHMQAYDIGGGQIRWDGVWEPGQKGQTRALCWALGDFANRFNQEVAAGKHIVHMQAYDLGSGQIRWDGVWESGDKGQTRALCWFLNDFIDRWDKEKAAGKHIVHLQGYDIGDGQIRWDGVWEPGVTDQKRALALTLDDFVVFLDEQMASNRRIAHLQAYRYR